MQPRLPFPFPTFNARSQAGAIAGLDDIVEFALADWDGHAGVAVGVLGFADWRRDVFVLGGERWFVSSEPIEHYCGRAADVNTRSCVERDWQRVAGVTAVRTNVIGSYAQVECMSVVGESSWKG